jgi:flagellar basal body P-ring formation protein FlgA
MIRNFILIAAAIAGLSTSAAAADQERPKLKAEATVTGDIVRIGDLVDHAGVIAKVPIFRAPDLGSTGSVSADAVVEAVRAYALVGLDTGDLSEVVVTRASRAIPAKEVEDRIAQALSTQYALGPAKDIAVNFDRELRALQLEASAKGEPRVAYLSFDGRSGRFDATLDIPTSATTRGTLRLSGRAAATVEVVTLTRSVERGEVLKTDDVLIERRPRNETGRDIVANADQAIGLAARASLQPGRLLRVADLMRPELIQRNETVTLVYEVPGITLTVRGKAVEGGA